MVLSLWWPLLAFAAGTCSEKDFRAELGLPREQGNSSWCYAHSAADLISQAVGQRISSIDIATTFLLGDERKLHKSKLKELREYMKAHPQFDARLHEIRKEEEAYKPDHILGSDGMVDAGGMDDEAIVLSNIKGLCLADHLPSGEENLEHYLEAIREDYILADDPVLPPGPLGAVENDAAKIMAHAFQKWVDQKCGKRFRVGPLLPKEVSIADNLEEFNKLVKSGKIDLAVARKPLEEELDRVLDSGKAAAIAYESYDLYPLSDQKAAITHGDHSSIVAARKMIDGKCHYFVRNHFGASCGYRPEFENRCERENGGVWVPLEALKHLYSVISVH
jgi:hypothetical protein